MSKEKKQRSKEYQKSYREAKKSQYNNNEKNNFNSYTNKIVFFNYDFIKCAIYLAVHYYLIPIFMSFRQTGRSKSPVIKFIRYYYYQIYFFLNLFFIISTTITITITIRF